MIKTCAACCLKISRALSVVILLLIGSGMEASGVSMATFDAEGQPIRIKEIVNENFDLLTEQVKQDLRTGKLNNISYLCPVLLEDNPGLDDIKGIYCIALASGKAYEKAEAELVSVNLRDKNIFALTAQAMILFGKEQYEQALTECKKAVNLDPYHPFPRNIMGRIHFRLENYKKALEDFQKTIELEPQFLSAYTNLGAAAFELGNDPLAMKSFQRSIQLNPRAHGAFFGIGLILEKRGRLILAITAFQQSLKLNPENKAALAKLGGLQLNAGQYDSARKTADQMKQSGIGGAHVILADVALHTGEVDEAIKILNQAPEQTPDLQYLLGFADILTGHYQAALNKMEAILVAGPSHYGAFTARAALKFYLDVELDPTIDLKNHWNKSMGKYLDYISGAVAARNKDFKSAEKNWQASGLIPGLSLVSMGKEQVFEGLTPMILKHHILGLLFYSKNFNDHAIAEFEKSLAKNNEPILSCYWAAKACLQKKDFPGAESYLERSLVYAPGFYGALNILAELQLAGEKPLAAVETFHKAYEIQKDPSLLLKLGSELDRKGFYQKAEEQYRYYIKDYPELFIGYNQLAWLFAKRGIKLDEAMVLAKKANVLQPENPMVFDTIGWIYYQKKDYDKALDYIAKAYDQTQEVPSILYHLAAVYYKKDKKKLAAEYLTRALKISNNFGEADAARRLLKQIS